jgi:hypothetical protein
MSTVEFVSPETRLEAKDENATIVPSPLISGLWLVLLPSTPEDETDTRIVSFIEGVGGGVGVGAAAGAGGG